MVTDYYTKYITTTTSNIPQYTTKISIMNKPFTLKCGYNTRNKLRWISIVDKNNKPILTQTFLKYGKQCEFNFLAERYNLSFFVTLKPKVRTKEFVKDYDYLNWADDFDLYFVGRSQELEERMRVSGRKVYVGN